jgi:uncharacterized membrane protein
LKGGESGLRVRTGIRAGFSNRTDTEPGLAQRAIALPVESRRQVVPVPNLQTVWQRLLSELQNLLSATAERAADFWQALRSSVRSRASPKVEIIERDRFWEIDFLRGLAIGMMLFHHLIHSWLEVLSATAAGLAVEIWTPLKGALIAVPLLSMLIGAMVLSPTFGYSETSSYAGAGQSRARTWQRVALFAALVATGWWMATTGSGGAAFIFLMGVALTLSYHRVQNRLEGSLWRKYVSRGVQILGWAMAITGLSLIITPQRPILFGILHMLGLATILAYPFLALPAWVSLAVGLPIIGLGVWLAKTHLPMSGPWGLLFGIGQVGLRLGDHWPLLPWFGVTLLGIAVGKILYPEGQRAFTLPDLSETRLVRGLSRLGRNSLEIYLLQMPIFLAGKARLLA